MTQRIPLKIKNKAGRSFKIHITDRPLEIKTTSLGAAADELPPLSVLTTFLGDDDVFVLTADGFGVEKEDADSAVP